jgi:hypothetical protein
MWETREKRESAGLWGLGNFPLFARKKALAHAFRDFRPKGPRLQNLPRLSKSGGIRRSRTRGNGAKVISGHIGKNQNHDRPCPSVAQKLAAFHRRKVLANDVHFPNCCPAFQKKLVHFL